MAAARDSHRRAAAADPSRHRAADRLGRPAADRHARRRRLGLQLVGLQRYGTRIHARNLTAAPAATPRAGGARRLRKLAAGVGPRRQCKKS